MWKVEYIYKPTVYRTGRRDSSSSSTFQQEVILTIFSAVILYWAELRAFLAFSDFFMIETLLSFAFLKSLKQGNKDFKMLKTLK